ncbi:MAG: polysaccharide deacetylase family protein [Vulcanimicrobiaceae bacterium]
MGTVLRKRARKIGALFALVCLAATLAAAPPQRPLTLVPVTRPKIAVLLFHQVSDDPIHSVGGVDNVQKPWDTPAQFERTLDELERRGFEFITMAQALDYLDGRLDASTLPRKPALLTFDDGYASAWTVATPILRRHHAPAAMFFEGARTDTTTGRLTSAQLEAMERSGIWTLESHGWAGHSDLVVSASGTQSPYWYANLAWLPAEHRFETKHEFAARVHHDLLHFRETFEARFHTHIDAFAYPSGEFGQNAPLGPGADPNTRLEAGHSNAAGLTPLIFDALRRAGYRAAFAVSIPGVIHAASRENLMYALPRLGVGSDFAFGSLKQLEVTGIELPEITSLGTFADCGPLGIAAGNWWTASTGAPEIFRLSPVGRIERSWTLPRLLDDRTGDPSLISAVIPDGNDLVVVQKSGWWPHGTPQLTRIQITGKQARVVARKPLPEALNWTVGAIKWHGRLIAMTDEGDVYEVPAGKLLFQVAPADTGKRQDRFAGPVAFGDDLLVFDRQLHTLLVVNDLGQITASTPFAGDIRELAATGDDLLAVDWSDNRHLVRTYRVEMP